MIFLKQEIRSVERVSAQCCFHTTDVMAIFVIFFAYFGQYLVAVVTSLWPLRSGMSSLIGRPQKPGIINNQVLVISHSNAFVAILVPKIVSMVTRLCPSCMGVS